MLISPPALGVLFIEKLMTKLPLWPNTTKMTKLGYKRPMQPVASTHPSSVSSPRDLRDDATSTLVLRLNQETRTPRLLVYGADYTQRHSTSQSSSHRVPDLCLTIPDPLHQGHTPASILVIANHAAPVTYTSREKQTRFST
jgi:hypothetical protein